MKQTNYLLGTSMRQVFLLFVFALSTSLFANDYTAGTGSESNPYQISTPADLITLSNTPSDWGKHFVQTKDINFDVDNDGDLTDVDWNNDSSIDDKDTLGFSPIGNDPTNPFTGSFDGQVYSIDHLYINQSTNVVAYVGLFGVIETAIDNIQLTNCDIKVSANVQSAYIGALVGYANDDAVLSNCSSSGLVSGFSTSAETGITMYIGGLIGAAINSVSIESCHTHGAVNCSSKSLSVSMGGLAGEMDNSKSITNCYTDIELNFDKPSSESSVIIGGLVGFSKTTSNPFDITNCYTSGSIRVNTAYEVKSGGLVGKAASAEGAPYTIINSYTTCEQDVNSIRYAYIGGLLGEVNTPSTSSFTIKNCYTVPNINATSQVDPIITGSVLAKASAFDPSVLACYYNSDVTSDTNNQFGEGKTTAELRNFNNSNLYVWDWNIDKGSNSDMDYPWVSTPDCSPFLYYQKTVVVSNGLEGNKLNGYSFSGIIIENINADITERGVIYNLKGNTTSLDTILTYSDNIINAKFNSAALISDSTYNMTAYAVVDGITISGRTLSYTISKYRGGQGTEEDPHQIANAADLILLSNTSSDWDAHFIQIADIDFDIDNDGDAIADQDWNGDGSITPADAEGFSPIGNSTKFTGSYNGDNYKIEHLSMNRTDGISEDIYLGLFGQTNVATLENIQIYDVNIKATFTSTDTWWLVYTGGIVGLGNNSKISNCSITGNIDISSTISELHTGGLAGEINTSEIANSFASVDIQTLSDKNICLAGLIGDGESTTVKNCYSTGMNKANSSKTIYAAGLLGKQTNGSVTNSYAKGGCETQASTIYVGGIVGQCDGGTISMSYATGGIIAFASNTLHQGGLVGFESGTGSFDNSYYDSETTRITKEGKGIAITTDEFKKINKENNPEWKWSTFINIDDNYPWFSNSAGRPYLYWHTESVCNGVPVGNATDGYTLEGNYNKHTDISVALQTTVDKGARYRKVGDDDWSYVQGNVVEDTDSISVTLINVLTGSTYFAQAFVGIGTDTILGDMALFTALKRPVITIADSISTYNGEAVIANTTCIPSGEIVYYRQNGTTPWITSAPKDAGHYDVKVFSAGTEEYAEFSYWVDSAIIINKADQVITSFIDTTITYGETVVLEASANVSPTYSTVPNNGIVTIKDNLVTSIGVGEVKIIALADSTNNYNQRRDTILFTVTKKALTVTAQKKSKVYGSENGTLAFAYSGFVGTEDDTELTTQPVISTMATATSSVGDYIISLSGGVDDNYSFIYISDTLSITPYPIVIRPDAKSKVYADKDEALTYGYEPNLVNSDKFIGELQRVLGENAGTYAIQQNTLSLGDNYSITYIAADYTINKAPLEIVVADTIKVFATSLSEQLVSTQFTSSTLYNSDIIDYVTISYGQGATSDFDPGTYTDQVKVSDARGTQFDTINYAITYVYGDIIVIDSTDTDHDGILDHWDLDDDGDGILSEDEGDASTDTDHDNIPNYLDNDDDNDGILTIVEGTTIDTDGDNMVNYLDNDDDNDGVLTLIEGSTTDTDADGIVDYLDNDDDNDGIPTKTEGSSEDSDTDGVYNYLDDDDDNDGILTIVEGASDDTDNDKIPNYKDNDDDNDGIPTLEEGTTGDADNDGIPNYLESDDDGDGIPTLTEGTMTDTDNDGVNNYLDSDDDGDGVPTVTEGGTIDTDADGKLNYLDNDDDNDGIPTIEENYNDGMNPSDDDCDGVTDYLDNTVELLMESKWDDVVLVNDPHLLYASYQWYKNDVKIDGATEQFYFEEGGLDGTFYVEVTSHNKTLITSCKKTFSKGLEKSATVVLLYPNPASTSAVNITLKNNNVSIEGISQMEIYNMSGQCVHRSQVIDGKSNFDVSALRNAVYTVKLETSLGETLFDKLIIQ